MRTRMPSPKTEALDREGCYEGQRGCVSWHGNPLPLTIWTSSLTMLCPPPIVSRCLYDASRPNSKFGDNPSSDTQ